MNKTIYIRDEDAQVWDRARELAGDKLSPVIVVGLKKFIAEKDAEEAETKGFERVEVRYNDGADHGIPKRKAFHGKWLFPQKQPYKLQDEDGSVVYYYALALTAKRNVVVLTWNEDLEGRSNPRFYVFPSLEAAAADTETNPVALAAIERLGVPVEELDI
jgi:hypothetical protein